MKNIKYNIKRRNNNSTILYLIIKWIFKVIFKLFYRISIKGVNNLPKKGGAIIASNHLSVLDPPLIGVAVKRIIFFMAKKELFDISFLRFIFHKTNVFPVNRNNMFNINTIKYAINILINGNILLMFPEGTRGKTKKIKHGIGMIACKANVPIIPVKIRNTDQPLKFKKVKIKFGSPIYPPIYYNKTDYGILTDKVFKIITKM
ncbi:MAG: 1-acyl-sn-glycerol-3-phosphate acyltransferase [Endomicrobium sp.]|jgi:1-acyl-sn-glycerol-3-phosphate acyltransferase|nr:1-acyl-sn-glycerol-3-phosphate acyltransferase [Endomicrobium sp.]